MSLEDDWTPPEEREVAEDVNLHLSTAMVVAIDFNAIPGGQKGAFVAATTIQLAWRQRAARAAARRQLATVYVKRPAPGGGVYYEHTVTGVSQWERPLLAARLFPYSPW